MKRKHFTKTLRKYRRLQGRLAESTSPKGFRHLFRKLDILQRRLLRLNRAWKLGLSTAALLAGMASPAQAQQFPASIDLDTLGSHGFVINGIAAGDRSGVSVSEVGDINGDGIDDLIIGAISANMDAGESYVVFGTATPPANIVLSTLNGSNGFVINGIDAGDRLGRSVSGAGDINGDGLDDLVIGAYWAAPNGNHRAGQSFVVFGTNPPPENFNLANLNGSNGFVINGIESYDYSGWAVSGAGDINGDGLDDLLVGAFGANVNGKNSAGESYVVFGSAMPPASVDLSTLNGSNGFVVNGIDAGDRLGRSVSGAGDINGDGLDDFLIGAPYAAPNENPNAGESYVVFGSTTPPARVDLDTLGSNGFVIKGVDAGDFSGGSVSGAGDINGDGFDDIIIGAYLADPNGIERAGKSYVVFGAATPPASFDLSTFNGSNGFVINGIDAFDRSGRSVSGVGDINGDGIDDLLIGALYAAPNGNFNAGESYVVFGTATPPVNIALSMLNGSNGFVINGIDAGDRLGRSVSGAGDINGDGLDDLVIGAPGIGDPNGNDAGESYVIFGRSATTSIAELVPSLALQLFPNPASDAVFVQLADLRQAGEISLSLFDVLGRELSVGYERVESDRLRVELAEVPAGTYLLRLVLDGEVGVSRLVKE